MFLGCVGAIARPISNDFFDPETVLATGGYIGATVAWGLDRLLSEGRMIGIVALLLIGFVLCLDAPLRTIYASVKNRIASRAGKDSVPKSMSGRKARKKRAEIVSREPAEPEDEPERTISIPKPKTAKKHAVVEMSAGSAGPKAGYTLPPLSLLEEVPPAGKKSAREMQVNIETLEATLEQFGIDATVSEVATGPTVTRFEIQVGPGVRVNRISGLADNIAMNLAASHVRVEAPIPGKNAIGVEVPTKHRRIVSLREMVESLEFHDQKSKLTLALGKDVSGAEVYTDLARMPHLLIGGSTNSGKSICLTGIIMSLILQHSPKDLRLVMIDPKRVELTLFEGLPHLMCPIVTSAKEAPGTLRAVWREMDRRYDTFSERGVRNIEGWNSAVGEDEKMPYIVVIIDELADLMMQAAADVETCICRLAQLARATGIHLVIATQRPSVDVITGTIKANVSSRIAFAMASQIDSRTIIDQPGAEKLIGSGDMLFLPIDAAKPRRIQGCYTSEKEITAVCDHWRAQEKPHYVLTPVKFVIEEKEGRMREQEGEDPLWEEAVRWVVDRKLASTSMMQRKFSIGFQRASRLLDMMEERNIVGKRDGPRPREVLLDFGQVEVMFTASEELAPVPDGEVLEWDEV